MSFYNHYEKRKDRRKQYYDSRAIDSRCKNHGACPWCTSKRIYKRNRQKPIEDFDY